MKNREQGVLTVEASIILTLFTFCILFLLSFARIYRAQNEISHATLQAVDAMALESYLRENALDEKAADVVYLASRITGSASVSNDSFESLRSADVATIAKNKFIVAIADTESDADAVLKRLGVKNGLSGIDFSASTIDLDNDDVIVSVSYTLEMQFAFFGADEINITKAAKAKTFGEILFEITADSENPTMGSASGGGSYQHGKVVQITAVPNYGYKFVSWNDGNTENPRLVTVSEAHKYIAKFIEDSFGVNVAVEPSGFGNVSGGGNYSYLSKSNVSASANNGYHFVKWAVYKHKDGTTSFSNQQNIEQIVDQSYTFTAKFEENIYSVAVEYECGGGNPGVVVTEHGNTANSGSTIGIKYGRQVQLSANKSVGYYEFIGWKVKGTSNLIYTGTNPNYNPGSLPAQDITYVACYKINIIPSISLSASAAGGNTVQLTANTVPENVSVIWTSSNRAALPIDNNGLVTANNVGNTIVTASFVFEGQTYSDYKCVYSDKTITLEHFCQRDASKFRHYYKTNPGPNYNDKIWAPAEIPGVWHRIMKVTWSDIVATETSGRVVYDNKSGQSKTDSQKLFKNLQGVSYVYETQWGYNETGEAGYIINYNPYFGMFFIVEQHAPKPNGGFYDYYITNVN